MDKLSGIDANTQNRLLYDAGIVYVNYGLAGQKVLGVTRGGNTCSIEQEIRQMAMDGAPGDVKGDKRRVKATAKLSINMLTMSDDVLRAALTNADAAVGGTHTVYTREKQISNSSYYDNVTLVLQKSGTSALFGFKLKNALPTSNFELGASDDDESVTKIDFVGHFSPTALDEEPWEIFNPLETSAVYYTLTYSAGSNGSIIGNTSQTVLAGQSGSAVYAAAADGYVFSAWSDAKPGNPRTDASVSGNVTVSASFSLS
jgi:hypothetical protein